MTRRNQQVIWLLFLLLGAFVCWPLLGQADINVKYDWGFALFDWQKTWHDATSAWNDYFLGQPVGINTAWLPLFVISLFGLLTHLPVLLVLKIIVYLSIVFSGVGMTLLLRNRGVGQYAAIIGGLIYAFSPLLYIRVIVGFLFYLIAMAIVPWLLKGWFITTEQRTRVWWGYLIPVLFVFTTAQPQFAVMILLILVLDLVTTPNHAYFRRAFGLIILLIASAGLVQLPWLTVVMREGFGSAATINTLGSSYATITSLPHSIIRTFIGADHHITFQYFDLLMSRQWFVFGSFGLITLAVTSILVARTKREARLFMVVLAVGWLAALGPAAPMGNIYYWLYTNLPFSNLFREVYHWSFLITLGVAFLSAVTIDVWWKKSKRHLLLIVVTLAMIGGYAHPFLSFGWREAIPPVNVPTSYQLVKATHENELDRTVRSFFLPPLGFIKFKEDLDAGATNNDIYALSTNRAQIPAEASVLDLPSPSTSFRSALVMSLYARDPYLAGFMQSVNANDIIIRSDLESQFPELFSIPKNDPFFASRWYNVNFSQILAEQPGIKEIDRLPGVIRFNVTETPSLIGFANHPVRSAFDWRILAERGHEAVFYLEDLTESGKASVATLPFIGSADDQRAAEETENELLGFARFTTAASLDTGWVRPSASWWFASSLAYTKEPYLFTKQGELAGPITIPLPAGGLPTNQLALKYWLGEGAHNLQVRYGSFVQNIDTTGNTRDGEWGWLTVNLPVDQPASELILAGEGITGIAQVVTLSSKASPPDLIKPFVEPVATDLILYQKQSSTRYDVTVSATNERWVIFRMAYDPGWSLIINGKQISPTKVNGLTMAWLMPAGDTEGQIIFAPARPYLFWQVAALGYLLTSFFIALRLRARLPV